jgi:heme exporter protein CcmD
MTQLFEMGGYEVYVWGSVALGVAVFVWNVLAPAWQRRTVIARLTDPEEQDPAADGDRT